MPFHAGSFGDVYRVEGQRNVAGRQERRRLAAKRMKFGAEERDAVLDRLRYEWRALARLQHAVTFQKELPRHPPKAVCPVCVVLAGRLFACAPHAHSPLSLALAQTSEYCEHHRRRAGPFRLGLPAHGAS